VREIYTRALGRLDGGLVLDVATGEGGYAGLLAAHLKSYRRIIGIDTSAPALLAARENAALSEHTFACADAERLAFCSAAFDTVAIAFSCHHLARPARVLLEMMRVLKPGGRLIIAEMHASARTVPQRTAVQVHHWAAAVDSALGSTHSPTFPRQRFVDWIEALPLDEIEFHDRYASGANPLDPQFAAQVRRYIDTYVERAGGTADYLQIARQAADLQQQIGKDGIQPEPILVIVARKRS
jgi:SAM-dependent methyltransferase